MFGAGPWQSSSFDETTHWPGRAVPIAVTIKQRQMTGLKPDKSARVPGPSDSWNPGVHLLYRIASPYTG